MPEYKSQEEKTPATVSLQPQRLTPKIMNIILLDINGYSVKDIAEMTGLTVPRVSIIRNSPLYKERRDIEISKRNELVHEKQASIITNEEVVSFLHEHKLRCAKEKVKLALEGEDESTRTRNTSDVLEICGIKKAQDGTNVNIVMTDKMFNRFERVYERALSGSSDLPNHRTTPPNVEKLPNEHNITTNLADDQTTTTDPTDHQTEGL